MAALAKSRFGIYGIVALAVIAITAIAIVGYRIYYEVVADTPEKAARLYLDVLNKGDMMKLYDMTRGASGQTQSEFALMVNWLIKDNRLSAEGAAIEPLGKQAGVHYFRVMVKLRAGDGSYRLLPIILETGKEGNTWRVGVYLPPSSLPTAQ
jgi:hypothetical protein